MEGKTWTASKMELNHKFLPSYKVSFKLVNFQLFYVHKQLVVK